MAMACFRSDPATAARLHRVRICGDTVTFSLRTRDKKLTVYTVTLKRFTDGFPCPFVPLSPEAIRLPETRLPTILFPKMKRSIIAIALASGLATGANAALLIGVTGTNDLVTFDSSAPGSYVSNNPITGTVNGNFITDIAYNGDNGFHYGLDTSANLYRIGMNGAALFVSGPLPLASFDAGFGYDPASGKLAFAAYSGAQLSTFNVDGSGLANSTFSYIAGDANDSATPAVFGFAVDPVFSEAFVLDEQLDTLGQFFDIALSEISTVGPLGVNATALGDLTVLPDGSAFAALSTDGLTTALYSINTSTGAATSLGGFSDDGVVALAAIPEPSVSILAGLAGSLMAFRRRRLA